GLSGSLGLMDRLVRIPDVDQLADPAAGQFAASLEPGFHLGALLGADRAAAAQADITEIIGTDEAQAVGLDGLGEEIFHCRVALGLAEVLAVIQMHFEAQFLEFVDAEFLAQAAGSGGHGDVSSRKVAGTLSASRAKRPPWQRPRHLEWSSAPTIKDEPANIVERKHISGGTAGNRFP